MNVLCFFLTDRFLTSLTQSVYFSRMKDRLFCLIKKLYLCREKCSRLTSGPSNDISLWWIHFNALLHNPSSATATLHSCTALIKLFCLFPLSVFFNCFMLLISITKSSNANSLMLIGNVRLCRGDALMNELALLVLFFVSRSISS